MEIPKELLIKLAKKTFEAESKRTEAILKIKSETALKSKEPGAAQKAVRLHTALDEIVSLRKRVNIAASIQKPESGMVLIKGFVAGRNVEKIKDWTKNLKINLYKKDGSVYSGASSEVSAEGEFSITVKAPAGEVQEGILKLEDSTTGREIRLKEPLSLKPGSIHYREFLFEMPVKRPERKEPPAKDVEKEAFRPAASWRKKAIFRAGAGRLQKKPGVLPDEVKNRVVRPAPEPKKERPGPAPFVGKKESPRPASGETKKEIISQAPGEPKKETPVKPFKVRYLGNTVTKEIHDLNNRRENCQIDEIQKSKKFRSLKEALKEGYDYCAYCFGKEKSKR